MYKISCKDYSNKDKDENKIELESVEDLRRGLSARRRLLTLLLLKILNIPTRFLRFLAPIVPFIVAWGFMAWWICELCVDSVSAFERSSNGISAGG